MHSAYLVGSCLHAKCIVFTLTNCGQQTNINDSPMPHVMECLPIFAFRNSASLLKMSMYRLDVHSHLKKVKAMNSTRGYFQEAHFCRYIFCSMEHGWKPACANRRSATPLRWNRRPRGFQSASSDWMGYFWFRKMLVWDMAISHELYASSRGHVFSVDCGAYLMNSDYTSVKQQDDDGDAEM